MIEGLENVIKKDTAKSTKVDSTQSVEEYINKSDWRISANANTGYSAAGLVNNLAGKLIANFWLDKVFSPQEGKAHRDGDIHIHDLDILGAYCFTGDTKIKTMEYGIIDIETLMKLDPEFHVASYDSVKDCSVICLAKNLRCTRENAKVIEITFSDGIKVKCTPDHKFLLTSGKWLEAIKLTDIDHLQTINNKDITIVNKIICDELEDVYCMEVEKTHNFTLSNGVVVHNCCGHDLQRLLNEGFNGVEGRVNSHAPKHVREALGQMANFIGILQSEWAGAQAFSSYDTYLSPYVFFDSYYEGMSYKDFKRATKSFVYNLNVPSRWGQSPFSNITIDWNVPNDLKDSLPLRNDKPIFYSIKQEMIENDSLDKEKWSKFIDSLKQRIIEVNGEIESDNEDDMLQFEVTYKLFYPEMLELDKAYYEVMTEGDDNGFPFTFPIPTVNITENFDWDGPNTDILFENTRKMGCTYFQNFIGSQYHRDENGELTIKNENAYSPNDVRSMAFLPDQEIISYDDENGTIFIHRLDSLVEKWLAAPEDKKPKYEFHLNGQFSKITEMFKIDYRAYNNQVVSIKLSNGVEQKFSLDHRCVVLNDKSKIEERLSQDVKPGDKFLFGDNIWTQTKFDKNTEIYSDKKLGDFYIVPVKSVEIITVPDLDYVYNFTIDNKDHLVELPNGVVSHQCPLTYDTQIIVVDENNKCEQKKIGDLYFDHNSYNCYYKGEIIPFNVIKVENQELIEITLCDGTVCKMGQFHEQPIIVNNEYVIKKAEDVAVGDIIPFDNTVSKVAYKTVVKVENKGFYDKGLYCLVTETEHHLFTLADGLITHNCRLQLDKKALRKRGGGLFGSDAQTGSIGVCTINMARLGYNFQGDYDGLIKRLDKLMVISKSILVKKRKFVQGMLDRGLYPYTKRYIKTLDTFFSTIGVNGMQEMVRNFTNDAYDITSEEGQKLSIKILDHIREKLQQFQDETGDLFNLEATPAEGTTRRFAHIDKKAYPERDEFYIECEKHGKVRVDATDEEEIECPLCAKEANN